MKKIEDQHVKNNKYHKVRDHCLYTGKYRGAAESTCNLNYTVKRNSYSFHNGLNYDYHFVIKELAEEFEGKFA